VRLLMTGAAGRIGTAFYRETAERYWFRLADRDVQSLEPRSGHEAAAFDIAELEQCRAACEGIDAALHLAADPNPNAGFYESLLDNNIKGVFNVFRAAKDAGCRRVVFASSVHSVAGYPVDIPIPTDVTVSPIAIYGATKCFGEALGAYFSNTEGLSVIAVRIGAYHAPWLEQSPTRSALAAYVSPRDLNQLIVRCLEAPDEVRFAIAAGQSNNRIKRLDLTSTRERFGYEPQDDGFALFNPVD
jgi:NAD+ dependent glucose-6-phosphate dehydrogenase